MRQYFKKIILTLFFMWIVSPMFSLTADEILQKIDAHRIISNSFEMTIRVESFKGGRFEDSTVMKGTVQDGKMTMIDYLEPESMKGRKILIKDSDMWIVVPNTKNPIRITAAQRLMGGISYGDIARVSYGDDYSAELNGEETVTGMNPDGSRSDPVKCHVLALSAKDRGANYHKITLWVDEENFLPVKADFFAYSGKKMSSAYYTSPKEFEGNTVITKIFLYDRIITSKHYSMEYLDMKVTGVTNNSSSSNSSENPQTNENTMSSLSNAMEPGSR